MVPYLAVGEPSTSTLDIAVREWRSLELLPLVARNNDERTVGTAQGG